ncbi:glycosyltransferase family 2 protein [Mucilaginibacter sp. Bleaf8]|uniref:glycosyltransferase family 2 protein n=1 Tax=Mucilaginibacter sp. Bleaf8 TaxID=2834430 RepID=UPI001BCE891C|nr:glycosyltransferase family 2 protein [Mucilaginibacter sp. Bleaf8]MBS7563478.1 glycosyltransferase family 2 protein [Mucilaginibacter sp. Bleaf8]
MNDPKVSIALCTYNGIKYLQKQLDSLIHQSYTNLEIIVVDDKSSDDTLNFLQGYANRDTRIKLHQNEGNLGLVRNFEKAINLCTGEYIALCDQDDIWDHEKIKLMVENIEDHTLIYHDSQLISEDEKNLVKASEWFNMYQGSNPLAFIFFNCVSGHACMFNRKLVPVLNEYAPLEKHFYHDWWIAFVAANCGTIKYLNLPLVKYRQHQNSVTDIQNVKEESLAIKNPPYNEINLSWLYKCHTFNGRYKKYIGRIINLLEHKTWLNSFTLMYLLILKAQYTYFIHRRKKGLSKINYLRKASFYKREF